MMEYSLSFFLRGSFLAQISTLITAGAMALTPGASGAQTAFGPANRFTLPARLARFMRRPSTRSRTAITSRPSRQESPSSLRNSRDRQQPGRATFDNTLVAIEKSGQLVNRVNYVFNGVTGANMNPELQTTQDEVAPKLAALQDGIYLNTQLFKRVEKALQRAQQAESRSRVNAAARVPIPGVCARGCASF